MIVPFDHNAVDVSVSKSSLCIELADGRTVCAPIDWFPLLDAAPVALRGRWRIVGDGQAVEWPELGERVSLAFLLSMKAGWVATAEPVIGEGWVS